MSYYRPPMGDYKTYGYAGDPGFLSGLWKGIKKIAGPVLGGLIGGPAGAVIGQMGSGGGSKTKKALTIPGTFGGQVAFPGGVSVSGAWQPGQIVPGQGRLPPFTATGPGVLPGGGRGGGVCAPSGWHFAKDGSGRLVRNRRMNVANPKALRRSLRRIQGFEKLVRRTFTVSGTVKPKRRRG